jgi:cell division septation protein DedD
MENNGKSLILQRTLGAAVLVAAAATLVPLVLDGDGLKSSRENLTIPDEPTFELQLDEQQQPKVRMLQAKGAINRAEQEAISAVDAAGTGDQSAVETNGTPNAGTEGQVNAVDSGLANQQVDGAGSPLTQQASLDSKPSIQDQSMPNHSTQNQSMEDVIQKLTRPEAEGVSEPPSSLPVSKESPALGGDVADSWTIQMGAFKDRGNAERTVANLVAKGYRAYLGTQTPGVFRVLVGPEIRRDRAEHLRDRVAADTGTRGVVVRYLP